MDENVNKIMTGLQFNILPALGQLQTLAKEAEKAALRAQEAFAKANVNTGVAGMDTSKLTAKQARVQNVLMQGEAKKAAIVAKGEAEISAIRAKEALTRQQIAQRETAMQLAATKKQVEQEKLLYMQSRREAFDNSPGMMKRRLSWLAGGAVLMGGFGAMGEIASTIKEVEFGMTTIARVTEDVNFNFKGMRDELQQLGVTYGNTWDSISDIAIRWSQAGYNQAETLELTKDSLLALNTAELSAEQATSGLIAIMAQWGLTSEELLPTIDKINKVADDHAVTSEDLVAGLTRSSGAAKVLGLNLNETVAILTTMREATGRTGKEVGNALNSILSFMQRPTAIKAFETEGIRVFADETRTQFRNVIEIFDEMATKWPQMGDASRDMFVQQAEAAGLYTEEMSELVGLEKQYTDIQQRDLSQAAAGIYRRNYLLALLQNWSKVNEVLITQENSLGYSMAENERTMQTLEKQIEVLKASAEQLAVALGDSGLLNEFKGVVEGTTNVIQWFNGLDDSSKTLILTLAEVTIAVKILSAALKGLGISGAMAGVGGLMSGWAVPIGASTTAMKGLQTVLTGTITLAKNLGKGIISAVGGPVPAALIATGTAVGFIAREINKSNEEIETHATMAKNLVGEYDSLSGKLEGMTKGTKEYNDTAKQLSTLKGNMAKSLPEIIDGWDKETQSLSINRKAMQGLIDAGNALKKSKEGVTDALKAEKARLDEETKAHEANAQQYESSQGVLEDLTKRRKDLTSALAKQSAGSQEAKTIQASLGETERLIADIAQEAGLKRNATIESIMQRLKELSTAEKQYALDAKIAQAEMTQDAINNTYRRLNVLNAEIRAKQGSISADKAYLMGEQGEANPFKRAIGKKQEEMAAANAELTKQQQELEKQLRAVNSAQNEINKISADAITSGSSGGGSPSGSSGSGSKTSYADIFKDYIDTLTDSLPAANDVVFAHNNALNILSSQESILKAQVGETIPTIAQQTLAYEYLNNKINEHKNIQQGVHATAEQYRQKLNDIQWLIDQENTKLSAGRITKEQHAQSVSILKEKYAELERQVKGMGATWWQEQLNVLEAHDALQEQENRWYEQAYTDSMNLMRHQVSMARMSTEQQIEYLEKLRDTHVWNTQQMWDIESQLFTLRKQQLSNYLEQLDNEYKAELENIEYRTNATINEIQAKIDALDDEDKAVDREEAERQHNKKISKLQKDRNFHELRTGREHQEAIVEIDEEIAEENLQWQKKQGKWIRDDKKDSYRQQIEDARESGEEERKNLERHYNKAKQISKDGMLDIIATLSTTSPKWYETGKNLIDKLIEGLSSGDFNGVLSQIGSLGAEVSNISGSGVTAPNIPNIVSSKQFTPIATISKGQYELIGNSAYMPARQLASLLGESASWDQATGTVGIGGVSFFPGKNENGTAYVGIREIAERLGYKVGWKDETISIFPQAHTGAYVSESGMAELLKGERVLSPDLTASFDRLASILVKTPDITRGLNGGNFDKAADRIIAAIERKMNINLDKVVNIEHYEPNDDTDIGIFSREIMRQIKLI